MASPQVVVLAGGLATRMLPRTEQTPKILLEVAGRPFVEWQLERLAAAGFAEAVLCIGHLGERVRAHVGDAWRGLAVRYSDDAAHGGLLGTLGALRAARPLLEPTFVVTYGDSYLSFDFLALLRALDQDPSAAGALAVFENDDRLEPSNAAVHGAHVTTYRKRRPGEPRPPELRFIDHGALALRREALDRAPGARDLGALQAELAASGALLAVVATERFHEIGSEAGLAALEAHLRARPG